MSFDSIAPEELTGTWGGVQVRLTQYGYRNDPYMDSYTKRGLGAYRHLATGESIALTDSSLLALGLSRRDVRNHHYWVDLKPKGGGVLHRRTDDRAPQKSRRADLYMPGGFDRHLPDYADMSLSGRHR